MDFFDTCEWFFTVSIGKLAVCVIYCMAGGKIFAKHTVLLSGDIYVIFECTNCVDVVLVIWIQKYVLVLIFAIVRSR